MRLLQRMGTLLPGARRRAGDPGTEAAPPRPDPGPPEPPVLHPETGSASPPAALPPAAPMPELPASTAAAADEPLPPEILAIMEHLGAEAAPEPPPARVPGPALPGGGIEATAEIAGFLGSCLVDADSGLLLAAEGGAGLDLEAAAALTTEVVRAEREALAMLDLDDRIEDILVTLGRRLHVIRPLERTPQVFLFVALDKRSANLGMARMQLSRIEQELAF